MAFGGMLVLGCGEPRHGDIRLSIQISASSGHPPPPPKPAIAARQAWMAVLARSPAEAMRAALDALEAPPRWTRLRGPEIGMAMVQGRMGGDGGAFNLGEMTVARASIRLEDGTVGHGFRAGRDATAAELAAVCDALLQGPLHDALHAALITPQRAAQAAARQDAAARAAATRVDFFGMVRMG